MMKNKLPEYTSFEEKEKHFIITYIDSIKDFEIFLASHRTCKGIYRGINQSYYKIYTSLQRQILEKNLKNFSVEEYILKARNTVMLKNYFQHFKIVPSKLSIWSYLQHYGAPTPLIDFTYDIEKAIYFAIEKHDESSFKKNNDMSDRFSIFFIQNSDLELVNIDNVCGSFVEYKKPAVEIFNSRPPEKNFDYNALLLHLDQMFDMNILEVFLLDNKEEYNEVFNLYNNIRIIAQQGLFINNSYLDIPLEEALKKFYISSTQYQASIWDDIASEEADQVNEEYRKNLEMNRIFQKRFEKNIIHSFEINKELIPNIRELMSIQKKDIYPNEEEIVWNIFTESFQ